MATGFPVKANYATGDVLTAANMNDLSGTVNLIAPTAKGDLFAGSAANTYTKLAVGTNGQVLTADSTQSTGIKWAAASSGALTLIKAPTTFTAVSDTGTTFDGVFSSSYTNYIIYFENVNGSTSSNLYFQWRVGTTTQNGANYNYYNAAYNEAGTLVGSPGGSGQTQSVLFALNTDTAASVGRGIMYTSSPGNSSERQNYNLLLNSQSYYGSGGGTYKANIIPTGFILSASTGTITGKVSVYGLAKS